MMRQKIAVSILTFGLLAGVAWAHKGATGIVMERMEAMTDLSNSMRSLSQFMRGTVPYDVKQVREAAQQIANNSGAAMTDLFPVNSTDHPSEASDEIWIDWNEFARLAQRLNRAASILIIVADNGLGKQQAKQEQLQDILAAKTQLDSQEIGSIPVSVIFEEINQTCKSCHLKFRI